MRSILLILSLILILFSCNQENKKKETTEGSPFVSVKKSSNIHPIRYYKSINEFTLQGENELHIDSISYPYIKRESTSESYLLFTFVYNKYEKKEIRAAWDEYYNCYYKIRDCSEPENTKWIQEQEVFYLDSFKLTVLPVNDVRNSDHFIERFTVAKKFEVKSYVPIHKENNYNKLDIRNVSTFIDSNEFAFITTINYDIINDVIYSDSKRMDCYDGEVERISSCHQINGYSIFWWHNFTSSFDKCKNKVE